MLEITYPPELPVSQRREEIAEAIRDHQVVIVAGETGSGKTTQLPKICLELGREAIGHTQPRRIAARTIAERVAEELGSEIGDLVGYQVRFTDESSKATKVKLMTDGILLAELRGDRMLSRYDTIIIDEAHERSLNVDFLLGYLKRLLPKRPDLKVIITSATIDPESFSKHFADAPIIEVSGRTYPVDVRYRPLVADSDDPDAPAQDRDVFEGIVAALQELEGEAPGDVLVFLPGEREIRDAEDAIRGSLTGRRREATEVLPLYGRLSARDQHRVFEKGRAPGVRRRVVLATNVAETSLTVPGIAYVIDTGEARISRYSTRAKVQRLPIEAISQASANQRSGRSGRTRDGIAIRLYSEADFVSRPEFTDPEILRTNLASVLLQMLELKLGAIEEFPFLTPPDSRGVKDGVDLLRELGAIRGAPRGSRGPRVGAEGDVSRRAVPRLTRIGRDLARLPIDPRYGRMVLASKELDVAREVLIIVAGLTIQDIRERPLEHRQQADQLHARFRDPTSDFFTLLNLWNYLEAQSNELGSSAFRRLCKKEFLNFVRFREWQDLFRQLREATRGLGLRIQKPKTFSSEPNAEPGANADAVHRALLTGLLSHIGVYDELKRDYKGARNTRFRIFPGSGLSKSNPDAVMAAELVETSALFARTVAKIDPAWAEELAGDLVKRQHAEPHWERKQGQAVALETVTLYGVPLVRNRRVGFAKIDPAWSRDLFIRHALVEGDWTGRYAFERKNRQLRRELEELEERTRQRGLIEDDEAIIEFFVERIPDEVVSQPTFDKWWREAQKTQPNLLTLTRADLLGEDVDEGDDSQFPRVWKQGDQQLKLRYKFDPNSPDDGVTATIPLPLLAMLEPEGFDWLVPGFRAELVTALLRSVPKVIRRNFVPAADWAAKLLQEPANEDSLRSLSSSAGGVSKGTSSDLQRSIADARPDLGEPVDGPLTEVLRTHMQRAAGIRFDIEEFDLSKIPSHLLMRFRVVDDAGRELGASSDLIALQQRLKRASEASLVHATTGDASRSPRYTASGGTRGSKGNHASTAGEADVSKGRSLSAGEAGVTKGAAPDASFDQRDITEWPVPEIPESFEIRRKHGVIRAWPMLQLRKPASPASSPIDLLLATTAEDQQREHARAVAALLARSVPTPASYVQSHLTSHEKLSLASSPYQSTDALLGDVLAALASAAMPKDPVRTRAQFEALRDQFNSTLVDSMFTAVKLVAEILKAHREALASIKNVNALAYLGSLTDAKAQLESLIFDGFVSRTGMEQLRHLPRYLRAVTYRLERLQVNAANERSGMLEIDKAIELYRAADGQIPTDPNAPQSLTQVRWLLEEFRVSLFAQQLGTAQSVSLKRIRAALT
ncbi:ATP-dependent RNA helicase HrpA [Gulosibacter chungangensis]|uniref:ATP-dependent RNA helicase HrpA n=1 Tax=Gulosibacter chungangensis TaxID=979746 RepID=A0A7J5BDB5_9MICO|nr:ATP-dependent RNA helicase HrpA [Gulosibacter chungangensis]KAB1643217.1 ATP-dependent RNA helicase HrpA [Gulosibacter chungangensis]